MFEWIGRNVLITGASGFIGSALVQRMNSEGAKVIALLRPKSEITNPDLIKIKSEISFKKIEINNTSKISEVISKNKIDTLFHLAANNSNFGSLESPLSLFSSNIQATWSVLEACRNNLSIERIVVASSREAQYLFNSENNTSQLKTKNIWRPYQVSKISAELIALAYADTYDLPIVISKKDNVYGGGDLNWNRLIPSILKNILNGHLPVLRSDGNLHRNYLYIDDVIEALIILAENSNKDGIKGKIVDVTTENSNTAIEIINYVNELNNIANISPIILNESLTERDDKSITKSNTINLIGWSNKTEIKQGLNKTINWYKEYFKLNNKIKFK